MTHVIGDGGSDLSGARADILFMLDQSGSVTRQGLDYQFDFVLYFIGIPSNLPLGPEKNAVAVATFNETFNVVSSFPESLNKTNTQLW